MARPREYDERRNTAVRLAPDLLEALDETAHAVGVSRNLLIELAVRDYLERMGDRLVAGESLVTQRSAK